MGDSQQELEEGARAAACVAADPVFSALDASGAPVIVADGDPRRVAFMNDQARVLFGEDAARMSDLLFRGDDPGSRRLVEVISALSESSALRLERLRMRFLGQAQIVTVLCRTLGEESGGCFLIAALGVRPDAPADDQRPSAVTGAISEETADLRRRLAARHGARAPRFLWRTDAEGRFIDVSHALADALGEAAADILGRSVKDASQALALDPAFARAVASHRAWSGVEVEWPLEGGSVPTTLGALPLRDSAQRFFGYQGYGVLHLDRARVAAPAAVAGSQRENPRGSLADNVIMLRAPSPTRVASDAAEALSSSERLAFDEIARALKEGSSVLSQADAAGNSTPVPADGQPATTFGSNHELIARGPEQSALALARALEEKLARTKSENALLSGAFDLSRAPLAIMAVDATIIRANAQFAACFGADARTLANRNLVSVLSPSDAQTLAQHLTAFRQDASARLPLIMSPRGGGFPVDLTLRQLPVEGKPTLLISVEPREDASSDERAIEAARLAAESANAAKSDFLTRVSHEIRTPLNAIIGFAEVMIEERLGPLGSPRYKEYLKDMHASGAHVLSLVNDLLDLSKIEAGKMELSFARVDANAVIAECASIMQAQANQGRVVIRLALAPGLPSLCADARSLKQILLNLLSNAVKFNEPGGQVIVSSALNDAGSVIIRVKDTGIGMSEEDVATALEPFRQVDASRGASGTGLGLPLTKALIEANHASFSIKSRHNEGTLIEIAFPPPQVLAAE
ncbi:ATP-binding protein [Methylocystis sp. B8]|uniref:PAS domain-containing sensor histidine kinase n=1 Tax=Methylocystis sp. B8 TaxID=544938 RepID=UPI0010FEBB68|nr:ATP-binding protein [Methylocystis sp. B8]TLG77731.1 PAS domain-containing protein [Methylocystis sp. B8]